MVEFLFLDLDDTILDFHKAERIAIAKTIRDFGVEPTEELLTRYHVINKWHWEQLELGKLTRKQVQEERFHVLFRELGREVDGERIAKVYMENLSIGHYFLPGAEEAVMDLHKKYRLFLASNGNASVQKGRMTSANLYRFLSRSLCPRRLASTSPPKPISMPVLPGFPVLTRRRP